MSTVQPLDIVFFRGGESSLKSSIISSSSIIEAAMSAVSTTIMEVQRKTLGIGTFSHVGIIIDSTLMPQLGLDEDRFYILESTYGTHSNGKKIIGVQIRDFDYVVSSYYAESPTSALPRIVIGKLEENPYVINSDFCRRELYNVVNKYVSARYDFNLLTLLSTVIPVLRPFRKKFRLVVEGMHKIFKAKVLRDEIDAQFCSELVARVLMACGVMTSLDPETVAPVDFLPQGRHPIVSSTYPVYTTH